MLMTGFAVFCGIALIFAKLPRRVMLRALKHDLMIDITVSIMVLVIHWGTFSGVMAATVAGLLTSLFTSGLKRLVGYIDGNYYIVGRLNLLA